MWSKTEGRLPARSRVRVEFAAAWSRPVKAVHLPPQASSLSQTSSTPTLQCEVSPANGSSIAHATTSA
jgi:hypothetical protein